jgi:hypothetical protein
VRAALTTPTRALPLALALALQVAPRCRARSPAASALKITRAHCRCVALLRGALPRHRCSTGTPHPPSTARGCEPIQRARAGRPRAAPPADELTSTSFLKLSANFQEHHSHARPWFLARARDRRSPPAALSAHLPRPCFVCRPRRPPCAPMPSTRAARPSSAPQVTAGEYPAAAASSQTVSARTRCE